MTAAFNKSLTESLTLTLTDGDFKKQTEFENENFSLLAVGGFFHDSFRMKYKRPRVLLHLTLLIESGYVLGHNYFICLNDKKFW